MFLVSTAIKPEIRATGETGRLLSGEVCACGILLARLGFVREGLARDYLFINGAWRDHVLTARLNPAFDASGFTRRSPPA